MKSTGIPYKFYYIVCTDTMEIIHGPYDGELLARTEAARMYGENWETAATPFAVLLGPQAIVLGYKLPV